MHALTECSRLHTLLFKFDFSGTQHDTSRMRSITAGLRTTLCSLPPTCRTIIIGIHAEGHVDTTQSLLLNLDWDNILASLKFDQPGGVVTFYGPPRWTAFMDIISHSVNTNRNKAPGMFQLLYHNIDLTFQIEGTVFQVGQFNSSNVHHFSDPTFWELHNLE